jgi:cbb3-type cytochrome oxidase subunit 3
MSPPNNSSSEGPVMSFMDIVLWLMAHSIVFVLGVFVLLLATIYWPGRRAKFERDAMIPLQDDR